MAGTALARLALDVRRRQQAGSDDPELDPYGDTGLSPDVTSPTELSRQYVDSHGAEEEPLYIRKPHLAGFLAGIAGGQEGIRTLALVREQYLQRKERQQAAEDKAAAIQQAEHTPAPHGYSRDPATGKLVAAPKPERPFFHNVGPGQTVLDREGKALYTAPPKPEELTPGQEATEERATRREHLTYRQGKDKAKEEEILLGAEMKAIETAIGRKDSTDPAGERVIDWSTVDPRTGMTLRERHDLLGQKRRMAIRRSVGLPGTGGAETPAEGTAAPAPAPGPEAPASPTAEASPATFTVPRSKFDAKYPPAIRKQKEAELAAAGGVIDEAR